MSNFLLLACFKHYKRRYLWVLALLTGISVHCYAFECDDLKWSWPTKLCSNSLRAYQQGGEELYLTGLTYHHRGTYTSERLAELNEKSWGGGWGRGFTDADGDWHGIYAIIFRDSHFKYQKMLGYGWQTYWPLSGEWKAGLGLTTFVVSRPDIYNSFPTPGVFPLASLHYRKTALMLSGVPKVSSGTTGNGNVIFLFARTAF